jgi:dUTP pyrophosphatase
MIKIKLLTNTAKLPTRNNPTDAGLDLYADEDLFISDSKATVISTGISISIPDGYVARIAPRSGLAVKHGIDTLAGVVDSSYRGEVKVVLAIVNKFAPMYEVKKGDKIAQLLIQPVELWMPVEVDSLDETERGANGFGSSGV